MRSESQQTQPINFPHRKNGTKNMHYIEKHIKQKEKTLKIKGLI